MARKSEREKRLAEVRRLVADLGLTIEDVFPGQNPPAPVNPEPAINPCEEQSAGFVVCNGVEQEFVPFPAGGPWAIQVVNGVIQFANAAGGGVEGAPPPRESGGGGAGKDESRDVT